MGLEVYTVAENMTVKEFAARLQRRRAKLGLTFQELSDRTGISPATLQRYEAGEMKKIPKAKLDILTQGLNTTVKDFITEDIEEVISDVKPTMLPAYNALPVLELLSWLDYEVETVDPDDKCQSFKCPPREDIPRGPVWIRSVETGRCYRIDWQKFLDLEHCLTSYAKFLVYESIRNAQTIKRPKNWRPIIERK